MRIFILLLSVMFSLACISCSDNKISRERGNDYHKGKIKKHHWRGQPLINDSVTFFKPLIIVRSSQKDRLVKPFCKTEESCLQICESLKAGENCPNKMIADVIQLWIDRIGHFNGEEVVNGLELIAADPEMAAFLYDVDYGNQVLKNLLVKNTEESCPDWMNHQVYFDQMSLRLKRPEEEKTDLSGEQIAETHEGEAPPAPVVATSPEASEDGPGEQEVAIEAFPDDLALATPPESSEDGSGEETVEANGNGGEASAPAVMTSPEPTDKGYKILIDGTAISFDVPVFMGFVKRCLDSQTQTFAEMAAEAENTPAFEMASQVIEEACGGSGNCVRIAYCSSDVDSKAWNHLTEIKEAGCGYEGFTE